MKRVAAVVLVLVLLAVIAVALTAKYTGASPDLIRRGFPYQDRDGRLMPGDVGRQTAWWHAQRLIKAPIAERDIVDESFLREALKDLR